MNDHITADNYRGCAATSNDHRTCLSASAVTFAFFSKHARATHRMAGGAGAPDASPGSPRL
jgi:hypothetical protein